MDFKRARSKEQKDQRLEEIIEVACKQYESTSYDKLTMASIAKDLSFSRVSLYSYAATKEEILLLVLIEDHKNWADDISNVLEHKKNLTIEVFAKIWSETYYRHTRLLSLYAIMMSIIEKNVSLEKLTTFKRDFASTLLPVAELIKNTLPFLTNDNVYKFNNLQFHFLKGLYPATIETEIQKEAIKLSGIPYEIPDFVESFTEYCIMILETLKRNNL
jgi:AcrR family transcriptional regulator